MLTIIGIKEPKIINSDCLERKEERCIDAFKSIIISTANNPYVYKECI